MTRDLFVISEVALAFILLSGAGLLIRSLYHLQQFDPGFDSSNVLTMALPMESERYPDGAQIAAYLTRIQEKIAAVPGVTEVATTSALPLMGWGWAMPFQIQGRPPVEPANRPACLNGCNLRLSSQPRPPRA